LLWAGVSVPTDHEAVPSGSVRWVSAETKQRELGAYERKVKGIRQGLAALDRIEGSYSVGDRSVSYVAFVDGAQPVVVAEQWILASTAGARRSFTSRRAISCATGRGRAGVPRPVHLRMAGTSAP